MDAQTLAGGLVPLTILRILVVYLGFGFALWCPFYLDKNGKREVERPWSKDFRAMLVLPMAAVSIVAGVVVAIVAGYIIGFFKWLHEVNALVVEANARA